eukprot:COSAG01_NODE_12675_length_1701_cov_2.937578_2_plen_71_part_00
MRDAGFDVNSSDDSDVSPRPKRAVDMTYGELQKECKRLKIKATGGTSMCTLAAHHRTAQEWQRISCTDQR